MKVTIRKKVSEWLLFNANFWCRSVKSGLLFLGTLPPISILPFYNWRCAIFTGLGYLATDLTNSVLPLYIWYFCYLFLDYYLLLVLPVTGMLSLYKRLCVLSSLDMPLLYPATGILP